MTNFKNNIAKNSSFPANSTLHQKACCLSTRFPHQFFLEVYPDYPSSFLLFLSQTLSTFYNYYSWLQLQLKPSSSSWFCSVPSPSSTAKKMIMPMIMMTIMQIRMNMPTNNKLLLLTYLKGGDLGSWLGLESPSSDSPLRLSSFSAKM